MANGRGNKFTSLREWQLKTYQDQQSFYNYFGNREWNLIEKGDPSNLLNTKLAMTFYAKTYENCSDEQILSVEATRSKIFQLSCSGQILYRCVFISLLSRGESREAGIFPLACVKATYSEKEFYVEAQPAGRVYTGWPDVLASINLPDSDMCFPVDGFYSAYATGQVRVWFQESPSCKMSTKFLKVASAAAKVYSSGVMAASLFFPDARPFLATVGAAAVFSAGRDAVRLVDRYTHHESVRPDNAEAALLWLSLSGNVVEGILATGDTVIGAWITAKCPLSRSIRALAMWKWVSRRLSAFGIFIHFASLILKLRQGTLDMSNLHFVMAACIFVANLTLTQWQVDRLIEMLYRHPYHISNLFNMASNTPFVEVQKIVSVDSATEALEIICGTAAIPFLRWCDMQNLANLLHKVGTVIRCFRRGAKDTGVLCSDLYKILFEHVEQALVEVDEACKYLRSMRFKIGGHLMFQAKWLPALDVFRSINRVLDTVNGPPTDDTCIPVPTNALNAVSAPNAADAPNVANTPNAINARNSANAPNPADTPIPANTPNLASAPNAAYVPSPVYVPNPINAPSPAYASNPTIAPNTTNALNPANAPTSINSNPSLNVTLSCLESRNATRCNLIDLASLLAEKMNAQNEKEFCSLCQILMNNVVNKFEEKMAAQALTDNSLSPLLRDIVLQVVIREFKEMFERGEWAQLDLKEVRQQSDSQFLTPLHCEEEYEMFAFEIDNHELRFDQFVYDATSYLFGDDQFLDLCEIYVSSEPLIVIQSLGKTAVFTYKVVMNSKKVFGTVVLRL